MKLKIYLMSICILTNFTTHGESITPAPLIRIKVASVSVNQTVYDYARNVDHHIKAIDMAVKDNVDVLSFPELSLTGYAADDYHQWNKNNETVWRQIQYIASYAKSKNPNLIISLGAPWHHSDKNLIANDPLYNINDRAYNTQITITNGKVVGIGAKAILANGPVEYENRHFQTWPITQATINITLPDGSSVPFGKPVISFGDNKNKLTLFHEQCAEAWPGIKDDSTITHKEQTEARIIASLSLSTDLSLVLNPSASRPQAAINKELLRIKGLCITGSAYSGAYIYTNYLGSESGIYAAEGSQIYAQNGKMIHHGQRYNFEDISYSSTTIDLPVAKKGTLHSHIEHTFSNHEPSKKGGESDFEKAKGEELAYEEFMRSISLWLRDYLAKQSWPAQGYVISLSGGADSGYGAVALATMIELDIKQEGIEGFFKRFPLLKCKEEALSILKNQGELASVDFIKKNMLTFIYLPTNNSSSTTLNAARMLIEGGELPNGTKVKGIGGTFTVHNVQQNLDEYLITHASIDMNKTIEDAKQDSSQSGFTNWMIQKISNISGFTGIYQAWMEYKIKQEIQKFVNAPVGSNPKLPDYIQKNTKRLIPTWSNPKDDLTMQNYQARTRLVVPWAIANQESKIPLVTSNASEAALGYTTAGGDMHMGGVNPIGGIPKSTIKGSLVYFQEKGLIGLQPIPILHYITTQEPTAELRKQEADKAPQTDEGDLGFSYLQSEKMERLIITQRNTPTEAFQIFLKDKTFPSDAVSLRKIILQFCDRRWPAAQFKRIMGTLAPYVGDNFDPHASVRTTVLGDHFKTDLALMTFAILIDKNGGPLQFEKNFNISIESAKGIIERSKELKTELTLNECPLLTMNLNELKTSEFMKKLKK